MTSLANLLRKDIDEAHRLVKLSRKERNLEKKTKTIIVRRRSEDLTAQRNPDEIREEYR